MFPTGNTFNQGKFSAGHARKVWREIRGQWPAGGKVSNVADWVTLGKIPAGTPAFWACDAETGAKTVKCLTDAQVKAIGETPKQGETASTDKVNGHIQEDIPILNGQTVGTATVINDGDICEYMFDEDVVAKLKTLSENGYKVVFVM